MSDNEELTQMVKQRKNTHLTGENRTEGDFLCMFEMKKE